MSITTYAELKSAIANWLLRDDLTSVIPDFIALAEADISRNLRHWKMESKTSLTVDAQYEDIPADWLETIRLYTTDGTTEPLELISQADLIDRKYKNNNTAGRPRYYAVTGGQFEFYPVPDDSYTAELTYVAEIAALSDSNTSNWLLSDAADVYLYGALVHSAPYLNDDARLSTWLAMYQKALDALNAKSDKAKASGTGLRMKIKAY